MMGKNSQCKLKLFSNLVSELPSRASPAESKTYRENKIEFHKVTKGELGTCRPFIGLPYALL